jgi:hypothetical protein
LKFIGAGIVVFGLIAGDLISHIPALRVDQGFARSWDTVCGVGILIFAALFAVEMYIESQRDE